MIRGVTTAGVALALVLVLPALATPASAALQDISFDLSCPTEPKTVRPASQPVSWECTARLEYTSASTGMTDPVQPAIVGLEFPEPAPWMRPVVSPPTVISLGPNEGEEVVTETVRVTVGATSDAPAFRTTNLWIDPYVIQHPREEGELSQFDRLSGTNVTVVPGYYNQYNVRIVTETGEARPQEALRYLVEIDNFSNGPTRFEFSLPSEVPEGFIPLTPEPLILGGRSADPLGGGEANETSNETEEANGSATMPSRASVPFEIQTPYRNGYVDERTPIQVQVDSFYAPDPTVTGTTSVVTTIGQARGVYIPGPAAPAAVLAAVGAALILLHRDRIRP